MDILKGQVARSAMSVASGEGVQSPSADAHRSDVRLTKRATTVASSLSGILELMKSQFTARVKTSLGFLGDESELRVLEGQKEALATFKTQLLHGFLGNIHKLSVRSASY